MGLEDMSDKYSTLSEKMNNYFSLIDQTRGKLFSALNYEEDEKNNLVFNKAFFDNKTPSVEDIQKNLNDADEIIRKLNYIEQEIQNEKDFNMDQKKLLIKYLNAKKDELEYNKSIIFIEAEKAGYQDNSLLEEKQKRLSRKLELETKLYWPPITAYLERMQVVEKKLWELSEKALQEKYLNTDERVFWNEKLWEIIKKQTIRAKKESLTGKTEENIKLDTSKIKISDKNIFEITKLALEIEWISSHDIVSIQAKEDCDHLQQDKEKSNHWYVPTKWKINEIYNAFDNLEDKTIGQKMKIIKLKTWWMSVGIDKSTDKREKRHIAIRPTKDGTYDIDTILTILYDHEIETHVKTNTKNATTYNIKSENRGRIEEWVALFNQASAKWTTLEEFLSEARLWDIKQYIWEFFDRKNAEKLLTCYFKLTGMKEESAKIKAHTDALRVKKWVSEWELWTRRKDMAYWEGQTLIREWSKRLKTPEWRKKLQKIAKWFYTTNLWFEDLENFEKITDNLWDENINPEYPYFIGKILYWKLFKGKLDTEKMLENDVRALIAEPRAMTIAQKSRLVKILKLIKEDELFKKSLQSTSL